jgi:hypothetical protein
MARRFLQNAPQSSPAAGGTSFLGLSAPAVAVGLNGTGGEVAGQVLTLVSPNAAEFQVGGGGSTRKSIFAAPSPSEYGIPEGDTNDAGVLGANQFEIGLFPIVGGGRNGDNRLTGLDVSGMAAPDFPPIYLLKNNSPSRVVVLAHLTGSATGNQFISPTLCDYPLAPGASAGIWYDLSASKWIIVGPAPAMYLRHEVTSALLRPYCLTTYTSASDVYTLPAPSLGMRCGLACIATVPASVAVTVTGFPPVQNPVTGGYSGGGTGVFTPVRGTIWVFDANGNWLVE